MSEQITNAINLHLSRGKDKPAHLGDFSDVCSALNKCLRNIERCVGESEGALQFEISKLKTGSAIVEVSPPVNANGLYFEVVDTFEKTVQNLQKGQAVDERLDFQAIESFQGFSRPISHTGVSLSLAGVGLNHQFVSNLKTLLEPDTTSFGSVTGMLEALTTHDRNEFILYPPIPNERVVCKFELSELEKVKAAHGHQVTVFGQLYYSKRKRFPVRVDVDSFDVEAKTKTYPSLLNARGISASSTDSTKKIRALRDEW